MKGFVSVGEVAAAGTGDPPELLVAVDVAADNCNRI